MHHNSREHDLLALSRKENVPMVKILFFASNPRSTRRLALDEEIRLIQAKIRAAEYRDVIVLLPAMAARPDDLLQQLNEHKPQVVHFSGHGSSAGEIILMDEKRRAKPVSATALKKLFTTLKDNIRVVVLNACFTQVQAEGIREVIDCVVGMKTGISDEAAITFAASFYRAIGFGRSVKEAFDQGNVALSLEGIPEENTPQLVCRQGVDPSTVFLIGPFAKEMAITLRKPKAEVATELQRQIERGEILLNELRKSPPSSQQELDKWSRCWHDWRRYSEQTIWQSFSSPEPLQWLKDLVPSHLDFKRSWEVRAKNLPRDIEGELALLKNLLVRLDNY